MSYYKNRNKRKSKINRNAGIKIIFIKHIRLTCFTVLISYYFKQIREKDLKRKDFFIL